METEYIRGVETNYLVMAKPAEDYRLGMIINNNIRGLLRCDINGDKMRFDVSSELSLKSYMQSNTFDADGIRRVVESVNDMLKKLKLYLLDAGDVVLESDKIFMKEFFGELRPGFCYYPGYNQDFSKGLSDLLQEMLGAINQNDRDAVVLAYSLYQESLKENYVIADLIRIVNDSGSATSQPNTPMEVELVAEPDTDSTNQDEEDYARMFDYVNENQSGSTANASESQSEGKSPKRKKKLHLF